MNYCLQEIRTDIDQYAKRLCCIVCCLPRPCRAAARCLQQYRHTRKHKVDIYTRAVNSAVKATLLLSYAVRT